MPNEPEKPLNPLGDSPGWQQPYDDHPPFNSSMGSTDASVPSASNKAKIALAFSIVGLTGLPFFAPIGAFLARQAADSIERGFTDPANLAIAKIAFWLGLLGTAASALLTLILIIAA